MLLLFTVPALAQNAYDPFSFAGGGSGGAGASGEVLGITGPAFVPSTWFIRHDGGTQTQCTGLVNAAYPGSGSAQACAFHDPFDILNLSTGAWQISAGDTVKFADAGSYFYGQKLGSGPGNTYPFCVGSPQTCEYPPFPNNVTFLGFGAGACHNAGHTQLVNPTTFVMLNDDFGAFDVQGSTGVDLECFDITAAQTCTQQGSGSMNITNTALTGNVATYSWIYNFGANINVGMFITVTGTTNGGGVFNVTNQQMTGITGQGTSSGTFTVAITHANVTSASDTGATAFAGSCSAGVTNNGQNGILVNFGPGSQGPDNLIMKDISVHGLSHNAIWGSEFGTSSGSVTTMSDFYCSGVGLNCFDTDSGGCNTGCLSQGTLNLDNFHVNWCGAVEQIPNGGTIGGNGYNYGVDQAFNGAGDCLVMIASGGTWNWTNSTADHCLQDCFDFLHLADLPSSNVIVNTSNLFAYASEGQTFKLGGKTATATNIVGISDSNWPFDDSFPANPPGWNALIGSTFRAGDCMAFSMIDGYTLSLGNITNICNQSTAWDFGPPYGGVDCQTSLHNCTINMRNIVTMGFFNPPSGQLPGGIFIGTTFNPFTNGSLANTDWWQTRFGTCPTQPNTTNCATVDPLFTAESAINAMNIVPLSGSPLLLSGTTYSGIPTTDIFGVNYSSPPPIGAAMNAGTVSPPTSLKGKVICTGKCVIQ